MSLNDNISLISDSTIISKDTSIKEIGTPNKSHPVQKFLKFDNNKTLCSFCPASFSKSTGISTIKRHFERHHEEVYNQIKKVAQDIIPYTEEEHERVEEINNSLFGWIISDQQPFNVVENEEFKNLFFVLDPRYKLPTRQTVSHRIEEIFSKQKIFICDMLFSLEQKMSITTDAWTACNNQGYISITLHWIDKEWKMKNILLDLIPIHESHTGLAFAENIFETLVKYNLGNKILAVTTDNAANMITFGQHLTEMLSDKCNNHDFIHFRCAAHILNLAVQEGIKLINGPIDKARKFSSKIRNSQPLFEELKKIFEMKEKPFLVPEVDVPTRWNSLYLSIQKLYRIKSMTDILVVSNPQLQNIYPTNDEWEDINVNIYLF